MGIEDPEKLLIKIAAILQELRIAYFVTGGFAVSVWGRPRATFDIDIVIRLFEPQLNSLAQALQALSEAGYLDYETAKQSIRKGKGSFNFIHSESGLRVDFFIEDWNELTQEQFKRRKAKSINRQKIYFISPEDLILSKLVWHKGSGSSRQLEDVESVIKISGKRLDRKYLIEWARKITVLNT